MSRPFDNAATLFFSRRNEPVLNVSVAFDMETRRDYGELGAVDSTQFTVTVTGETPDGEGYYREYESEEAAALLKEMFEWEDSGGEMEPEETEVEYDECPVCNTLSVPVGGGACITCPDDE